VTRSCESVKRYSAPARPHLRAQGTGDLARSGSRLGHRRSAGQQGPACRYFPATARELSLDCFCPDYAFPCKHLAATFYLLAESFDDDPFAILAWRGREREDLLANLAAARTEGRPAADRAEQAARPLVDCRLICKIFVR
jgi:hypothetical protein